MFRGIRHTLFLLVQSGIASSAALAWVIYPESWQGILVCLCGGLIATWFSERLARRWLRSTVGRLRRVAEDIGRGRPASPLTVRRGDDLYKLVSVVNLLAGRLEELTAEEQRLQEQLRRSERLATLGEFAASVAHEVNNPLDGIQSCVRILRRSGQDPSRAQHMLDLIDSGLGRIDLIVRRLLTLAREHVIRPTHTRVGDVLRAALAAAESRISAREIRVTSRFELEDDWVEADPQLLEQVFVNLILNALDSMEPGGALSLVLRRDPDAAAPVVVAQVVDTGHGIPPDVLPHVFEPFFTTKADGKGTGLGLPIAARIVDAHRGTLTIVAAETGGTVATVRLPALPRDVSLAGAPPAGAAIQIVDSSAAPATPAAPDAVTARETAA